jgi:hypothetical protein
LSLQPSGTLIKRVAVSRAPSSLVLTASERWRFAGS